MKKRKHRYPRVFPWMLRDYLDDGSVPTWEILKAWPGGAAAIVWSLPMTDEQIEVVIWNFRHWQVKWNKRHRRYVKTPGSGGKVGTKRRMGADAPIHNRPFVPPPLLKG